MHDPIDPENEAGWQDPDAVLWVRGVDYVARWREAKDAAAALSGALEAVGLGGGRIRAGTAGDGSGVVRLELSAATVRSLARLVRVTVWRRGRAS